MQSPLYPPSVSNSVAPEVCDLTLQEHPTVHFNIGGSGKKNLKKAFDALTKTAHSTPEIERFVQNLERTSPKLLSELSFQLQKVKQEKASPKRWHPPSVVGDTNTSRRVITPQTSSHTWSSHSQASDLFSSVPSQAFDFSSFSSSPFPSWSRTKPFHSFETQVPLGPPTAFSPSPPPLLSPAALHGSGLKRGTPRTCTSDTSSSSRFGMVSSFASSHGSLFPECDVESRSSTYSEMSVCEVSSFHVSGRKRTRSWRRRHEALSSESRPSLCSAEVSVRRTRSTTSQCTVGYESAESRERRRSPR